MTQISSQKIVNIESVLDSSYQKVLELRKAIDFEDSLTKKFNMRNAQAVKSNWKLNTQECNISYKADCNKKKVADETKCTENFKQQIKSEKDMKKQIMNKRRECIKEKKFKLESKFFNFYEDYDSKNLVSNTEDYRKLTVKKKSVFNTLQQEEKSYREHRNKILINSSDENIFKNVYKPVLSGDNNILSENQVMIRSNRDLNMKCLQNKGTIQEFSIHVTKYNL